MWISYCERVASFQCRSKCFICSRLRYSHITKLSPFLSSESQLAFANNRQFSRRERLHLIKHPLLFRCFRHFPPHHHSQQCSQRSIIVSSFGSKSSRTRSTFQSHRPHQLLLWTRLFWFAVRIQWPWSRSTLGSSPMTIATYRCAPCPILSLMSLISASAVPLRPSQPCSSASWYLVRSWSRPCWLCHRN